MKNLFVPYDIALKLKEKDFKERCIVRFKNETESKVEIGDVETGFSNYISDCVAPTYTQVIEWFDIKKILIEIKIDKVSFPKYYFEINKYDNEQDSYIQLYSINPEEKYYYNRRQALNNAIIEALNLI